MPRFLIASFAALVAATVTLASESPARSPTSQSASTVTPAPKDTSIPLVNFGNLWDFEADGDKGVWLQTRDRKWYYASMFGPCIGLSYAQRIGVTERGYNSLDKYGTLIVDRQRCQIDHLTISDGPPKRIKKTKI
jgi:hypothetical protein